MCVYIYIYIYGWMYTYGSLCVCRRRSESKGFYLLHLWTVSDCLEDLSLSGLSSCLNRLKNAHEKLRKDLRPEAGVGKDQWMLVSLRHTV